MPEFNPRSKGLRALRDTGVADALVNPIPVLTCTETDVVVTRRRVSAFTGSDLEIILRAKNIDHLVLTGISTSGVVLSTVREAVDKDYLLTVVSDLCADRDEEVHASGCGSRRASRLHVVIEEVNVRPCPCIPLAWDREVVGGRPSRRRSVACH